MKLNIQGSSVYPMEQLSAMLLPNVEGAADCKVCRGSKRSNVKCRLNVNGSSYTSQTWVNLIADEHENIRLERRAVARAFYRAMLPLLEKEPEWGMLSGVRSAKLARMIMENGGSEKDAVRFLQKEYFVSRAKAELCARAGHIAFDVNSGLESGDFSLYAHIPFCPTRCSYCSFISHDCNAYSKWGDEYFDCLIHELSAVKDLVNRNGLRGRSIYVGGGTPTILEPFKLETLCRQLRAICPDADEFTVESGRPDSITEEKLRVMAAYGVNRICVNPQTMKQATLDLIGRRHSVMAVRDAYDLVRKIGIKTINCDLIAGLPGESPEDFADSLNKIIELEPENITVHTLAIKRGSTMNEKSTGAAPAEFIVSMLGFADKRLSDLGYRPYYLYRQKYTGGGFENIGWAKPGHECFYNVCMMEELGDIISVGAASSTKLTSKDFVRITNPKYPDSYIREFDSVMAHMAVLNDYFKND